MAEGEGTWWGGWFQQSYQVVKDKSAEAYEFIKRDLAEFSNVVQHDTTCSIVATAHAVRTKLAVEGSSEASEKVKKSLSNILGVITDTLAPPPDKTIDCDVITLVATPSGTTEVYDSTKARLYSLQADPATYCNEPDGPPEQFDAWTSSFSLEDKKAEISELLVNSPSIRALYNKMVPAAVAHSEFWQRYFYKVFQLEQEEARRVALKQRAEQTAHRSERESLGWEEEEEDEFLGATSTSRLDFTPPLKDPARISLSCLAAAACSTPQALTAPQGYVSPSASQGAFSPIYTSDVTPSLSSDSVSLPTQLEAQLSPTPTPAPAPTSPQPLVQELSLRLSEASLEEVEESPEEQQQQQQQQQTGGEQQSAPLPEVVTDGPIPEEEPPAAPTTRTETNREDGPQDLRVFELNSDSGKSTPSNNGKKGSSTDVSEDWEKDFDLDMTEEEVQMALSKMDGTAEDEDWENWD
ncbi:BSD domain-containing protein 1 isoform X2 [Clupea harengus]|uniref:BSD domain-containing protein 1 isoform X2 n=1 Tax=Clupea harengus TaxID=7950 RepID=A0A6P3VPX4_CLUHA|nr:BSD domain-containing protein 1 isoform X2 [Clupea harengus]